MIKTIQKSSFLLLIFFISLPYAFGAPPSLKLLKEKKEFPLFKPPPGLAIGADDKNTVQKLKAVKKAATPQFAPGSQEKVLVIMVDFPADTPPPSGSNPAQSFDGAHTQSYFDDLIFNSDSGELSMRNYYDEVSYGNVEITGSASDIYGPYTLDHCLAYYGEDNGGVVDAGWSDDHGTLNTSTNSYQLIYDAVAKADADINFSLYDTNPADGVVDHLIIIHAGGAEESSDASKDIWSVRWRGLTCSTDEGISVNAGAIVSEDSPVGIFAHEFGHELGLPDLYDSSSGTRDPVGTWCLMGYGCWGSNNDVTLGTQPAHICAYLKSYLGWLTPVDVDSVNDGSYPGYEVETNALTVYKIMINSPDEYFLIENRNASSMSAWFDKRTLYGLILDSGLIISHVNESYTDNEGDAGNSADSYQIWIEDPGLPGDLLKYKVDAAYTNDDGQVSFTPSTTPNTNDNSGIRTGISISNIEPSGAIVNFRIDIPPSTPTGLSVSAGETTATVTWTGNSESDLAGYNVYCSTSSGSGYTVANPTLVSAAATSYTDTGLSAETTYYYVVTALDDSSNESRYSSEKSATTQSSPPSNGGGGGGGGCFIATACFGTPYAEEVNVLCEFRDNYLLTNFLGRKFVAAYYKMSPPLANFIRRHEGLKKVTRLCLKPLIWIIDKKIRSSPHILPQ